MNNEPLKSSIHLSDLLQLKNLIQSNKWTEIARNRNGFEPILKQFAAYAYQLHLMRRLIVSQDKILQVKIQEGILDSSSFRFLKQLIDCREQNRIVRANYSLILESLKNLTHSKHFELTIPSNNIFLRQIRKTISEVAIELRRYREMSDNQRSQVSSNAEAESTKAIIINRLKERGGSYTETELPNLLGKLQFLYQTQLQKQSSQIQELKRTISQSVLKAQPQELRLSSNYSNSESNGFQEFDFDTTPFRVSQADRLVQKLNENSSQINQRNAKDKEQQEMEFRVLQQHLQEQKNRLGEELLSAKHQIQSLENRSREDLLALQEQLEEQLCQNTRLRERISQMEQQTSSYKQQEQTWKEQIVTIKHESKQLKADKGFFIKQYEILELRHEQILKQNISLQEKLEFHQQQTGKISEQLYHQIQEKDELETIIASIKVEKQQIEEQLICQRSLNHLKEKLSLQDSQPQSNQALREHKSSNTLLTLQDLENIETYIANMPNIESQLQSLLEAKRQLQLKLADQIKIISQFTKRYGTIDALQAEDTV